MNSVVVKRNGSIEEFMPSKIDKRIEHAVCDHRYKINGKNLLDRVVSSVKDNISTRQIDELISSTAYSLVAKGRDYERLATSIFVSSLHKNTHGSYEDVISDSVDLDKAFLLETLSLWKQKVFPFEFDRDYDLPYTGLLLLCGNFLAKGKNGNIIERPQHFFFRVAAAVTKWPRGDRSVLLKNTYDALSMGRYVHATPTLLHAGKILEEKNLASCYLKKVGSSFKEKIDSISSVGNLLHRVGGVGVHVSSFVGKGTVITYLKVLNEVCKFATQDSQARPGTVAAYLEPWHVDIFDFLSLKKNTGDESLRARNIFLGLWIPDLFMRRVKANEKWSLFDGSSGLDSKFGEDFDILYTTLEKEGKAIQTTRDFKEIMARDLWNEILAAQIETGNPYVLFKDTSNKLNMQDKIGMLSGSNLCSEILEVAENGTAVCTLASLNVSSFVKESDSLKVVERFDWETFDKTVRMIVRNLNCVLINDPVPEECKALRVYRPIGIGVQGLADLFMKLKLPFTHFRSRILNRAIFERLYVVAVSESIKFAASPVSCWDVVREVLGFPIEEGIDIKFEELHPFRWQKLFNRRIVLQFPEMWEKLKKDMGEGKKIFNSLLVAVMPTATTSQIFGSSENIEPITSNYFVKRTSLRDFIVVNKFIEMDEYKEKCLLRDRGSAKSFKDKTERELFLTVWEMKQKDLWEMATDRAPFVDQSQSLNLYLENPSMEQITSCLNFAWENGLKTGMYYLRTKPAGNPIPFTLETCNDNLCCVSCQ